MCWLASLRRLRRARGPGARYARALGLRTAKVAVVVALNLALGGIVVLLKVLVSHHH